MFLLKIEVCALTHSFIGGYAVAEVGNVPANQ
jgi:hypothetical protein